MVASKRELVNTLNLSTIQFQANIQMSSKHHYMDIEDNLFREQSMLSGITSQRDILMSSFASSMNYIVCLQA